MTPYFQLVILPCMLNMLCMGTSFWVNKVPFMVDRVLAISVLGKLSLVSAPFISEDGRSGSEVSLNLAFKGSPQAVPDESHNGFSGIHINLQHPEDPLAFMAPMLPHWPQWY